MIDQQTLKKPLISALSTQDLKKKYLRERRESLVEKQITKEKLATKFPVFKDVKGSWSYNYAAEEKKRFKAEVMWEPEKIRSMTEINEYLRCAF